MRFSDYTPSGKPKVVIDGALTDYDGATLDALAQNATLLAVGRERARMLVEQCSSGSPKVAGPQFAGVQRA